MAPKAILEAFLLVSSLPLMAEDETRASAYRPRTIGMRSHWGLYVHDSWIPTLEQWHWTLFFRQVRIK
jgi:hypothetical protein